jgi:hypothetical protein
MADGAVIVGVAAVLTSGVLGPLVLHQAQKDRDDRADVRATLDAAAEPLAIARAHDMWLGAFAFDSGMQRAEVTERLTAFLEQGHIVEAHALKLELRFPGSELAGSYKTASGALGTKGAAVVHRMSGITPTVAVYDQAREAAEREYRDAYTRFVRLASRTIADL